MSNVGRWTNNLSAAQILEILRVSRRCFHPVFVERSSHIQSRESRISNHANTQIPKYPNIRIPKYPNTRFIRILGLSETNIRRNSWGRPVLSTDGLPTRRQPVDQRNQIFKSNLNQNPKTQKPPRTKTRKAGLRRALSKFHQSPAVTDNR